MKLTNFLLFSPLQQLRQEMKAELLTWSSSFAWKGFSAQEWQELSDGRGLDVNLGDFEADENGLFHIKGKKVLVYIRDQWLADYEQDTSYRFHLTDCTTLQQMRRRGRYQSRYVVTADTTGIFVVNKMVRGQQTLRDQLVPMSLCKHCWKELVRRRFSHRVGGSYDKFSISQYFEAFETQIQELPTQNFATAPLNEYSDRHKELSILYRKNRHWRCEACNCDFSQHRELLHLHHKNGLKSDNSIRNIVALCVACHSREPLHDRLHKTPQYRECKRIQEMQISDAPERDATTG